MPKRSGKRPTVTILIEWENAVDVDASWVHRALQAFAAELARCQDNLCAPARVMYLYDRSCVQEHDIRDTIAKVVPQLPELCVLELVPTPGLAYYQLKNYGAHRTTTEFVIMLDSDTAPQPGWLLELLKPFADPEVMAVGGFTTLGYNSLVSRVMALIWTFNLPSERDLTPRRKTIHANNCAFRTAFFQANPWPDLPAFKKQCGFWVRDLDRRGIKWVRTATAMTVHAPQPGMAFLTWRAWMVGRDCDLQAFSMVGASRRRRLGFAASYWLKKCWRSTRRIVRKGHEVQLPIWQMPAALCLAYGYYTILFVAQVVAALTRRYAPLATLQQATQS
jgi:hypothetical protein